MCREDERGKISGASSVGNFKSLECSFSYSFFFGGENFLLISFWCCCRRRWAQNSVVRYVQICWKMCILHKNIFLINFLEKSLDFSPLYRKKFTNNEHVLYLDNSHLFTCVRNLKFKNTSHGNYALSKKHLLHLKWWKYGADEEEVKLYNSIVDLKIISQLCLWKPFWINDFLMIRIIVLACMHAMFFSYSSSPSSTTSSWCKQHICCFEHNFPSSSLTRV